MENKEQAKQEPQAPQAQPEISVTGDDVRRFIPKALFELKMLLNKQRNKYGARYNRNNKYESALRNFDFDNSEKVALEWIKIREKRSTLPATVRDVIKDVGNAAMALAVQKKLKKLSDAAKDKDKGQEHEKDDK